MSAPVTAIRSRDNATLKALIKLASSSRERRRTGSTLLEGDHLVRAYEASGGTAEAIFASETAYAKPAIRRLVDSAPARARYVLADALLDRVSQLVSASTVAAVVRTPGQGRMPSALGDCLVLENVQDPGNLGTMLRTAVAAGIRDVILSKGSVFAWAPKVVRAGMGAHFSLNLQEGIDIGDAARAFPAKIVALGPRAGEPIHALDLREPVAWLFGNEGAGLSEAAARVATHHACIPMPGPAESLNIAAAAAICLFEQVRQRAEGSG